MKTPKMKRLFPKIPKMKIPNRSGMTLVELILSITLFSMIMIFVISSVYSMTIARHRSVNRIALTEELYQVSEQLFTEIKNGGTIDYEEYWNRMVVNMEDDKNLKNEILKNGHYSIPSGVGNFGGVEPKEWAPNTDFGKELYRCVSGDGQVYEPQKGCLDWWKNSRGQDQFWKTQRFGQYALQFWDFNSNKNDDNGDEDRNNDIIGDEDDLNLWNGPEVFVGEPKELYLIDTNKNTRTFFRWIIRQDPNAPTENGTPKQCQITNDKPNDFCVGNIQILKLKWYDFGDNHKNPDGSKTENKNAFDGKIDTWLCDTQKGWDNCKGGDASIWQIATGLDDEWMDMFSHNINVRNFRLDIYPKKDPWLSKAAPDCESTPNCISPFIHPYVRLSLELGFSHGHRRTLRNENPTISISTTISLDDFR